MAGTPQHQEKIVKPLRDADWLRLSEQEPPPAEDPSPSEVPADPSWPRIPGYEILGVLGRGGMGVVYKARQRELGRAVALKMLLAGAQTDATNLARFRTEGEAIAHLQHPNIVQIFEVGSHNDLPYLVLEYVPGGGLDEWLRYHRPAVEETACLVEIVARAVHAAHERGIIHRDLKPANILLAHAPQQAGRLRDTVRLRKGDDVAKPHSGPLTSPDSPHFTVGTSALPPSLSQVVPKVADFGLAKRIAEGTGLTRSGALVGTPAYMAPEQLGTSREKVGPAADIYALGVILYEMLAGRPPYDAATPGDILLQVSLRDPIPPRDWRPRLPADLETICLKCLNKEPRQRYPTALALAEDLRRFLEHEPVQARPVSAVGRLGRWVRRHPVTTALAAAVGLLVVATAAALVHGFLSVRAEQQETEKARLAAVAEELKTRDALAREHRRREQIQQVLDVMTPALMERPLADGTDLTPVDRHALQQAALLFRDMAEAALANPGDQDDAANSFGHLARIRHRLNETAEAEPAYLKAIELYDALAAAEPGNLGYRRAAAMNRIEFGRMLATLKRFPDGIDYLQEGRALMLRVMVDFPDDFLSRQNLNVACSILGALFLEQGKNVEAEQAFCQAAQLHARQLEEFPGDLELRRKFALLCASFAQLQDRQNRPFGLEGTMMMSIAILQGKPPQVPSLPLYDETLAGMLNDLGTYLMNIVPRRAEAEKPLVQAVHIREQLVARFQGATDYAVGFGGSCTNLGSVYFYLGRSEDALKWHNKAIGILMPIHQSNPGHAQAQLFYRNSLVNRAIAFNSRNRLAESAADWEAAARLSPLKEQPGLVAQQADCLVRAGDFKGASTAAARVASLGEQNPVILYRLAVAFTLAAGRLTEDQDQRESCCRQALTLLSKAAQIGLFQDPAWRRKLQQEESFQLLRNLPEFRTIETYQKD